MSPLPWVGSWELSYFFSKFSNTMEIFLLTTSFLLFLTLIEMFFECLNSLSFLEYCSIRSTNDLFFSSIEFLSSFTPFLVFSENLETFFLLFDFIFEYLNHKMAFWCGSDWQAHYLLTKNIVECNLDQKNVLFELE